MARPHQLIKSPFQIMSRVILITQMATTSIAQLLRLREVNRTFREAIDEHLLDHWNKLVYNADIYACFAQRRSYVLRQIFLSKRWMKQVHNKGPVPLEFELYRDLFLRNQDPALDQICLEFNDLYAINEFRDNGKTLLMEAVEVGLISKVRALLDRGAEVDPYDGAYVGDTSRPLSIAVQRDVDPGLIELLVERGASVNGWIYGCGRSILYDAFPHHPRNFMILVKLGATRGGEEGEGGSNSGTKFLHLILEDTPDDPARSIPSDQLNDHISMIRVLVEHGADLSSKDDQDRGLLEKMRHPMILRTLLELMDAKGLNLLNRTHSSLEMKNAIEVAHYHPREGLEMIRILIEERGVDPRAARKSISNPFYSISPGYNSRIHYSIEAYIQEQMRSNAQRSNG